MSKASVVYPVPNISELQLRMLFDPLTRKRTSFFKSNSRKEDRFVKTGHLRV